MKSIVLILFLLLSAFTISAQLTIAPGAQFSIAGNLQLTLQNTDLINNGNFTTGNSITSFTGNTSSSVSGSQPIQFSEIEINKSNNSSVRLQRAISVTQRIHFTSGFLNLNSFNADLGTTGHLDGEKENTCITGSNGGEVLFNVNLNSPTSYNPANLGVYISSGQNLGNTTIKRGHQSQVNGSGFSKSILRYYDIIPTNHTNLNATLRFSYMDGELNGLNENAIVLFESQNTIKWVNLGFTSRDVVANFVEKTGISHFGRFTLSRAGSVLPARFILFNAKCEGNKTIITWNTSQEQNSSHFDIERSADGSNWTVMGSLPATGTSIIEKSYSLTDNSSLQNGFYRIAEYDLDGNVRYSAVLRSSCIAKDELFSLWPNPTRDKIFIHIVATNESPAILKIFDSKGALIKMQRANVLRGSNQLSIEMASFANGIYLVSAVWNNGQSKTTIRVVKR